MQLKLNLVLFFFVSSIVAIPLVSVLGVSLYDLLRLNLTLTPALR